MNDRVHRLCVEKLDSSGAGAAAGGKQEVASMLLAESATTWESLVDGPLLAGAALCAWCDKPMSSASSTATSEDSLVAVALQECGCVLHTSCLMDMVQKKQGITLGRLPQSLDDVDESFSHIVLALGRFFGILAVTVDSLECPKCHMESSSWRKCGLYPDASVPDDLMAWYDTTDIPGDLPRLRIPRTGVAVNLQHPIGAAPDSSGHPWGAHSDEQARHARFLWG